MCGTHPADLFLLEFEGKEGKICSPMLDLDLFSFFIDYPFPVKYNS